MSSNLKRETISAYTNFDDEALAKSMNGDVCRILRGVLRFTPRRLSSLSSVKQHQLASFEAGMRNLSTRDRRWLVCAFNVAGADVFMAQGHLQATVNEEPVIINGSVTNEIKDLKKGDSFREARWDVGLSQKVMARQSGVPQHIISAIENNHHKRYHLGDLLCGNRFLTSVKPK